MRDALVRSTDQFFNESPALARLDTALHVHGFTSSIEPTDPSMLPRHPCLGARVAASVVIPLEPHFGIFRVTDVVPVKPWALNDVNRKWHGTKKAAQWTAFVWRIPDPTGDLPARGAGRSSPKYGSILQ